MSQWEMRGVAIILSRLYRELRGIEFLVRELGPKLLQFSQVVTAEPADLFATQHI